MQTQGRHGRQPLATSRLVVRSSIPTVGFHPLHDGLDAFAMLLDEHAAEPGGIQREAPSGDSQDACEETGRLARHLVADPEDVARDEQGTDDRIAHRVLRGDGMAGPFLRDMAMAWLGRSFGIWL